MGRDALSMQLDMGGFSPGRRLKASGRPKSHVQVEAARGALLRMLARLGIPPPQPTAALAAADA